MDISFIIVNWNTSNLLLDCLRSIVNTVTGLTYEIFVVDNGSVDESVNAVKEQFGARVILIENCENRGFAKANNQALSRARGNYIVLLNTDTILQQGSISTLTDFLRTNPSAAVVGPRMIDARSTGIPASVSAFRASRFFTTISRTFPLRSLRLRSVISTAFKFDKSAK